MHKPDNSLRLERAGTPEPDQCTICFVIFWPGGFCPGSPPFPVAPVLEQSSKFLPCVTFIYLADLIFILSLLR